MIGVIVGIVMHLAAGVWFAARLEQRVSALEKAVPVGSIQVLTDRTEEILRQLKARP